MNEAQAPKNPQRSRQLSDAEVLAYTSADPFAQTTSKPWEFKATSPFLRKVAIGWVILVMAIHIFMGITLDVSFTRRACHHH